MYICSYVCTVYTLYINFKFIINMTIQANELSIPPIISPKAGRQWVDSVP